MNFEGHRACFPRNRPSPSSSSFFLYGGMTYFQTVFYLLCLNCFEARIVVVQRIAVNSNLPQPK